MATDEWNILAGRIVGDGSIEVIESELPITIESLDSTLSTPPTMTGQIANVVRRLKNNGRPVFEPWNTVLIAEAAGIIRGMAIYRKPTFLGPAWDMDLIGLSGYPIGMPYTGEATFVQVDPLDIYRHIWEHLQDQPNGNLGVTVDLTESPVRVGEEEVEGETSSQAGPRKLNWWETKDLGSVIDSFAKETPFDWRERLYWGSDDQPHCHIELGYPQLGERRPDLRLVLGENLSAHPSATEADYVNQVMVLGAGEGRERIRGYSGVSDGRLRRVRTVDNKGINATAQANAVARDELVSVRGQLVVDEVEVFDHPNAPIAAIELGAELPLYADEDWVEIDQWARVVGKSESPQQHDRAVLTIVRSAQV